jgi:hypothetical protein
MEMRRNPYIFTVVKYDGKSWFGRPKRRRDINTRYQTKGLETDSSGFG